MLKLGAISDTHNQHSNKWALEPCDIIIHCGDFSFHGNPSEINQFFVDAKKALKDTGAKYFLLTPGNHELGVQANESLFRQMCKDNGITLLVQEAIELEGIKFFGTPFQPFFCDSAYNIEDSEKLTELYDQIPQDTQVLITHCPPKGMLDYSPMCGNVGSPELWTKVQSMLGTLKYHFFGHIHYSHGVKEFLGTKFINAAIVSDHYNLNPQDSRMIVVEL